MYKAAVALLLFSFGCSSAGYKTSYVMGAVTKEFSTNAYDIYSNELNQRINECCDGGVCEKDSEDQITKSELDECLGNFFNKEDNDKIKTAIDAYYEAAQIHTAAMSAVDGDPGQQKDAALAVLNSAKEMLKLLPNGEKLVKDLNKLTGGK